MKRKLLAYSGIITAMMLCAAAAWGAVLLGTTGDGYSSGSTLVEIDSETGATIRTIGPVGYIVNGMEYDATTDKLYGSTSIMDPRYNGLIEIDMDTGAGTPIGLPCWGLNPDGSCDNPTPTAVTNITVDSAGRMYGWWDPHEDNLVAIDKATGIATTVGESGLNTGQYGLDFDNWDVLFLENSWWDFNVYIVDPSTGLAHSVGESEIYTHHGDFHPETNLYYGISSNLADRSLVVADLSTLSIIATGAELDDSMHTITFVPYIMNVELDKAKIYFKDRPSGDKYDLKGEITVLQEDSDGINPPNEKVTVRVGISTITIPAGNFEQKGTEYKCYCVIDGVKVKMKIKKVDIDVYKFHVKADGVDLSDTANPVYIFLGIGNDRGDSIPKLKGKLEYKGHPKAHHKHDH